MADGGEFRSLAAYSTYMTDRYQATDVQLGTYKDMLLRDPTVSFANNFVTRSVARRIGEYVDDRDNVAEWVNRQVMPAVRRDLRCIQSAIYYGLAIAQPRYGDVDGELGLLELVGCDPQRFWSGERFKRNADTGELETVQIDGPGVVPFYNAQGVRQIVHYASGDAFGSPWGRPAARTAYTAYWIRKRLEGFEGIGLEKHGVGTAFFKSDDPDRLKQYVADWVAAGSESAFGIDRQDEYTIEKPGWQVNSPYSPAIARLNGYICFAFGLPPLTVVEANFGTRAQASVALEAYVMAETDHAERLADVVLNQVIEPAVYLRFGKSKGAHSLPVTASSEPDLEVMSRVLMALSTAGAFDPASEDQLRWVGRKFGLPVDDLLARVGQGQVGPPL